MHPRWLWGPIKVVIPFYQSVPLIPYVLQDLKTNGSSSKCICDAMILSVVVFDVGVACVPFNCKDVCCGVDTEL